MAGACRGWGNWRGDRESWVWRLARVVKVKYPRHCEGSRRFHRFVGYKKFSPDLGARFVWISGFGKHLRGIMVRCHPGVFPDLLSDSDGFSWRTRTTQLKSYTNQSMAAECLLMTSCLSSSKPLWNEVHADRLSRISRCPQLPWPNVFPFFFVTSVPGKRFQETPIATNLQQL